MPKPKLFLPNCRIKITGSNFESPLFRAYRELGSGKTESAAGAIVTHGNTTFDFYDLPSHSLFDNPSSRIVSDKGLVFKIVFVAQLAGSLVRAFAELDTAAPRASLEAAQ
ncbi:MAG: hypothetical protein OXL96_11835 [Candidatus Poribacteria bacterium]|nr:hypothetical protein [Candidatus Poribacteria bacterium]